MFTKELQQNSKESTSSSCKAKEYELQKCIGQGAYAKVYKALHIPSNTKVAVKLYEKAKLTEKLRQKSIKREIKILSRLNHPNVVNFIDCFSTKNHIYLVMELVRGLSLYELLKKQPDRKIKESNAKTIIKQILKALVYCHSKCVTHRDIKLENVIISSTGEVKVIDFGFSTCIPNDKKVKMFCGTPSYMAPEIANKTEYCGPPVDVWATGVLFFVLVSGKFPFKGSTDKKLYHRISTNDPVFETPISDEAKQIILQMMAKNADDRPTTADLLNSAYFKRKRDASTTKLTPDIVPKTQVSARNYPISPMANTNSNSLVREDRTPTSPSLVQLGKTTRLFNDVLTNLNRENQMTHGSTTPLRDDTHKVLNTYYAKGAAGAPLAQIATHLAGYHSPLQPSEKDRQSRELWPSRAKKEENKPLDSKRVDDRTKKSIVVSKDPVKDKAKKTETVRTTTNTLGIKRTLTDGRDRFEKGDFTRFLDFK